MLEYDHIEVHYKGWESRILRAIHDVMYFNMTPDIVVLLWNTPEGALVSIVELLSQDNHIKRYKGFEPLTTDPELTG